MYENDLRETICKMLLSTERQGITDLIQWMDDNGFFDAPCSGKYHLAVPGGNARHAMNVCYNALSLFETLCGGMQNAEYISKQNSVVLCALLHDLGKTGQFGKPNYIPDPETLLYKTNKDLLYVPHEIRSVAIASRFIVLTEEEQFAILHHNGLYGDLGNALKGKETPLQMIIHFADLWAARVTEKEASSSEHATNAKESAFAIHLTNRAEWFAGTSHGRNRKEKKTKNRRLKNGNLQQNQKHDHFNIGSGFLLLFMHECSGP